jgi:hypothetical protein
VTENNQRQQPSKARLSDYEVEEKSADSHSILNHPVFQGAVDDVYSRAEGILLDSEVGSLTASAAHATMKAITDIRNQLEQYVNDHKMRKKYPTG